MLQLAPILQQKAQRQAIHSLLFLLLQPQLLLLLLLRHRERVLQVSRGKMD
jgi:hypothetical protein